MSGSQVPSAARALHALRILARSPGPIPASTLATQLGIPRSSTYHLLGVMEREGFVTHLPDDHRWGLGIAAHEVGSAYLRHEPLERLARPLLVRLVDRVSHTAPAVAHLGVLHGRDIVYLLKEQSRRPVTVVSQVGVRLPAHLTASGRSILAQLPQAQVRALFPSDTVFTQRTGKGPATRIELRQLLADERVAGWSVEDGFITDDYASVAAAAFDHQSYPLAAIGVTFRSGSVVSERWPWVARLATDTAAALTARLRGHQPG